VVTDRAPQGLFPTTLSSDWCGEWQKSLGIVAEGPRSRGVAAGDPEQTLYDEL